MAIQSSHSVPVHNAAPKRGLVLVVAALWVAVVLSALTVVYSTHKSRVLTNQLAEAEAEAAQLKVQRGQFLLERSAWGAYSRVESLAADKLAMGLPEAAEIVVVER